MIRCIAIDDEPLALKLVETYILQTPILELVGIFNSAAQALSVISEQDIQLVYLDIQMPEVNGIEFAKSIHALNPDVKIVFTTAFNNYAVDGYKVNAVDYLLKPFDYQEFLNATLSVQKQLQQATTGKESKDEKFFFVKADYKMIRVDFNNIRYIEAVKDYLKIHLVDSRKPIMPLGSMKWILEKLPTNEFVRIHRSYIVSVNKIDSISKNAVNIGEESLPVGDQYKDTLHNIINQWI